MLSEKDIAYSPSCWSTRGTPKEITDLHLLFAEKESKRNREIIPCRLDIAYGKTARENYDLYGTDLPDDAPIYIHIHGGYWQMLNKELSSYMAKPLYRNGYKVIVIGYEICPAVTVPQIMVQIERAISHCLDYAHTNKSHSVYIGGHSAGAHLIATLFTSTLPLALAQRDLIKEVFLISGVYDLTPLVNTYVNDALNMTEDLAREISPLFHGFATSRTTAFSVIVGECDPPAFIEQSERFYKKLSNLGVKARLLKVEGRDHFDIVEGLSGEGYELVQMILQNRSFECERTMEGVIEKKLSV